TLTTVFVAKDTVLAPPLYWATAMVCGRNPPPPFNTRIDNVSPDAMVWSEPRVMVKVLAAKLSFCTFCAALVPSTVAPRRNCTVVDWFPHPHRNPPVQRMR